MHRTKCIENYFLAIKVTIFCCFEWKKLNINLKSAAVEENCYRYEIPCEYANTCDISKNLYAISTSHKNIEIDHEERNSKVLHYCCYQNVPFCCDSKMGYLKSELEVYNECNVIKNPYENIGMTTGNNHHYKYFMYYLLRNKLIVW